MKGNTMAEPTNSFTVFRRQVIQTGSYEPSEASCSVTITVDPTLTKEELGVEIAEWGATCDIANYEALGLAYEVTEQGVRMLQKSVPRVTRLIPWQHQPRRLLPPVLPVRCLAPRPNCGPT